MQIRFLKTRLKYFIRFLSECIVNLLQGKRSEVKKKSLANVQRQHLRTVVKRNNLEATKKFTFVAKMTIAHKNNFPLRH